MASEASEPAIDPAPSEYNKARNTKFKFKSKSKRRSTEDDDSHSRKKRRRERESSHTSSRRHKPKYHETLDDDPDAYDDTYERAYTSRDPDGFHLDPDTAFRESLFDAMADDEGAAFWEGVYGQPIHVYPDSKSGPDGELERMNEEEYAEYVRARMWEKSHQHIFEERVKREEERKKRKEREDREWREGASREDRDARDREEREAFESKIAASLRRGEERKAQKRWQEAWTRYVSGWEHFQKVLLEKSKVADSLSGKSARGIIPWPVESGKWKNAEKEDVEDFFRSAVPASMDLAAVLKAERVRWHPDKMQQRFGANKLDEETVRTITAVFQVIDRLWSDLKEKKK